MANLTIVVRAAWDPEAKVWVATSNDIPGVATEAETLEELRVKLEAMIPELIQANGIEFDDDLPDVPMVIMSEQLGRIRLRA